MTQEDNLLVRVKSKKINIATRVISAPPSKKINKTTRVIILAPAVGLGNIIIVRVPFKPALYRFLTVTIFILKSLLLTVNIVLSPGSRPVNYLTRLDTTKILEYPLHSATRFIKNIYRKMGCQVMHSTVHPFH